MISVYPDAVMESRQTSPHQWTSAGTEAVGLGDHVLRLLSSAGP